MKSGQGNGLGVHDGKYFWEQLLRGQQQLCSASTGMILEHNKSSWFCSLTCQLEHPPQPRAWQLELFLVGIHSVFLFSLITFTSHAMEAENTQTESISFLFLGWEIFFCVWMGTASSLTSMGINLETSCCGFGALSPEYPPKHMPGKNKKQLLEVLSQN